MDQRRAVEDVVTGASAFRPARPSSGRSAPRPPPAAGSPTVAAQASACLFGRRGRHPYYIVAPHYPARSAGGRALYILCHALNGAGEEAYIVHDAPAPPEQQAGAIGLRAPLLTPEIAREHHAQGRAPVAVHPEVTPIRESDAVNVFYLLNYLGVLVGAIRTLPPCDLVVAYSANIARRTLACETVVHVPVVDASFWTPDPAVARLGPALYAGKYVEEHGQSFPGRLRGRIITRNQPDSPTPEQLRHILRSSTCVYIFENTAVAIEAALCGCPVVYCFNEFFDELIAEQELGLDGFVPDDHPASLASAAATVDRFRGAYEDAVKAFGPQLMAFVDRTQALARSRVYERPFQLEEPQAAELEHAL